MEGSSLFWYVFWAGIGGVLVLVGIVVEELSDKPWYKSQESQKRWKRAKALAIWLGVTGGIFIEVIVAGATAYKEWTNSPQNNPPLTVAADAVLEINTPSIKEPTSTTGFRIVSDGSNMSSGGFASMNFFEGSRTLALVLSSDSCDVIQKGTNFDCVIGFRGSPLNLEIKHIAESKQTVGELVSTINDFELLPFCFTNNVKILGGTVNLILNGYVVKTLPIPPQEFNGWNPISGNPKRK
jgi:hypothetical protein